MPTENRKSATKKSSDLPVDYLQMVNQLVTNHFEEALKAYGKLKKKPYLQAGGAIFPEEMVMSLTLGNEGGVAATTFYASVDFDPKASSPSVPDLLGACLDALGTLMSEFLDGKKPDRLGQLADESLGALEDAPFEWTATEVDRFRIYLKIDKANPRLDQLAEDWLAQNDPTHKRGIAREQKDTEKLFVTGKKSKQKKDLAPSAPIAKIVEEDDADSGEEESEEDSEDSENTYH